MERIAEQLQRIDAKVEAPRAKLYACLVDAENTQPSKLASVIGELNSYGEVVVRRIYGDFSRPNLLPWKTVANELSFRPHAQFAIISGKGSSDMAMAMDAIDLLHDGGLDLDGFALVSSDSDFTPLASKLREEGRHVIGFGRRTTPTPFVNACHTFVHLENLDTQSEASASVTDHGGNAASLQAAIERAQLELARQKAENDAVRVELAKAQAQLKSAEERNARAVKTESAGADLASKLGGKLKGLDTELNEVLASCLADPRFKSADGWVDISLLPVMLRRRNPSWDVRNYGVSKSQGFTSLLELPEVSNLFELKRKMGKNKNLIHLRSKKR